MFVWSIVLRVVNKLHRLGSSAMCFLVLRSQNRSRVYVWRAWPVVGGGGGEEFGCLAIKRRHTRISYASDH